MKNFLPQNLITLAEKLEFPLYLVGGACRDFLLCEKTFKDLDICSPLSVEKLLPVAKECGFSVVAEYKRTGTAVLSLDGQKFEYTSFRKEAYLEGGSHTPVYIEGTEDILEDALRRDFKCNAIYYDILEGKFNDPLGGVFDVKNRVLSAVSSPDKVFSHDGLRLMRLARFSAQLNFEVEKETLEGAKKNASNIKDISKERILEELYKIFSAPSTHSFSSKDGHYKGLKVLEEIGVLDYIFPQLTLGRGMAQNPKYHLYDVLEHSLKTVFYSPQRLRLAALLHDVGKPYCYEKYKNFYSHEAVGERIAKKILTDLKVSNEEKKRALFLIRYHMLDFSTMREVKIRRFIADNFWGIDDLIALKNADARACKGEDINFSGYERLVSIIEKMKGDGTPFTIKELKISAADLMELGFSGAEIGNTLKDFRARCIDNPSLNDREKLLKKAKEIKNN